MPFTDHGRRIENFVLVGLAEVASPPRRALDRGVLRLPEMLRRSWLAVLLLSIALVLLISAAKGERGLERVYQLERDLEEAGERNFRLVQQIEQMRHRLHAVRTDDATLERLARRNLGMVRPGEVLYQVLPQPTARGGVAADGSARRYRPPQ